MKTILILFAVLALAGCASTEAVLKGVDYACVDIQADGPWTDSGMQGRGIVLPEGETLTAETIDRLCN
jgi:hypothetical protein